MNTRDVFPGQTGHGAIERDVYCLESVLKNGNRLRYTDWERLDSQM